VRRLAAAVAIAVAIAGLLGGCGHDPSAPAASSARQLADLIATRRLGCDDFTATPAGPAVVVGDTGKCTVSGKQMNLAVFRSERERDRGTIERLKGCVGRRALNPQSDLDYAYVSGPTWIVISASQPVVTRVANALHADVQKVLC